MTHVTYRLTTDALGGATARALPPETRLTGPAIRALAVSRSPELVILDLQQCEPGVHITIKTCPNLRRLLLPEQGPGAVIHLDAGRVPGELAVSGLIDELDACWQGGDFRIACNGEPPFNGGQLGNKPAEPDHRPEALVLINATQADIERAVHPQLRRLHCHAVNTPDGPGTLDLSQAQALSNLDIQDAQLHTLVLPERIARVRLATLPRLRSVQGGGASLAMEAVGEQDQTLVVTGSWEQLTLGCSQLGVMEAKGAAEVFLRSCRRLRLISLGSGVRLDAQASSPRIHAESLTKRQTPQFLIRLLDQLAAGDMDAYPQLITFIQARANPASRLKQVRELASRLDTIDPDLLWDLRCLAHHADTSPRRALQSPSEAHAAAGRTWAWQFPPDLYQEGWEADLALFTAVAATKAATPFHRLLGRIKRLDQSVALAWGVRRAASHSEGVPEFLRKPFSKAIKRLGNRPGPPAGSLRHIRAETADLDQVHALVQAVGSLQDRELGLCLLRYAEQSLDLRGRMQLLSELTSFGLTEARARLLTLVQGSSSLFAAERQRAMRVVLAPSRVNVLARPAQEVSA